MSSTCTVHARPAAMAYSMFYSLQSDWAVNFAGSSVYTVPLDLSTPSTRAILDQLYQLVDCCTDYKDEDEDIDGGIGGNENGEEDLLRAEGSATVSRPIVVCTLFA